MNGSDRCHGIRQERAMKEGVDINIVLKENKNDIENKCLKCAINPFISENENNKIIEPKVKVSANFPGEINIKDKESIDMK